MSQRTAPGVATHYRSLGYWPAFLQAAWERIEPLVGMPAYEARKQAVVGRALEATAAMPPRYERGAPGADRRLRPARLASGLRAVLPVFSFWVFPDLLIDVILARAMLDGPDAACRSRFSVA